MIVRRRCGVCVILAPCAHVFYLLNYLTVDRCSKGATERRTEELTEGWRLRPARRIECAWRRRRRHASLPTGRENHSRRTQYVFVLLCRRSRCNTLHIAASLKSTSWFNSQPLEIQSSSSSPSFKHASLSSTLSPRSSSLTLVIYRSMPG